MPTREHSRFYCIECAIHLALVVLIRAARGPQYSTVRLDARVLVSISSRAAWGSHPVRSISWPNFPRRAFPVCCCAGATGAATVRQVITARRTLAVPGTSDAGWSDGIKDIAPFAFVTHFVPFACNVV